MPIPDVEVAVVGGGAAGLSAALSLVRALRRVVVIDAGSPRNAPASHMHGFLSREGMPPSELLEVGRREIRSYGGDIRSGTVTGVSGDAGRGFTLDLAEGDAIVARRIVLATGMVDELPRLVGAPRAWGRDLLHCPYCHGYEVRDRRLAVLGGPAGSIDYALLVRQWSAELTYLPNGTEVTPADAARLAARGVSVRDGVPEELVWDHGRFEGIRLGGGALVQVDAVFTKSVARPRLDFLGSFADLAQIRLNPDGTTGVDGVWATGNLVDPRAQVIAAAGHANAVAMDVNAELVRDDLARTLV